MEQREMQLAMLIKNRQKCPIGAWDLLLFCFCLYHMKTELWILELEDGAIRSL